jgi:hypothetical protein
MAFRPSSRAPHRTGAMAHGLADILAYQAGSLARRRRMEAAQTTGVAECGKYDTHARTPLRVHLRCTTTCPVLAFVRRVSRVWAAGVSDRCRASAQPTRRPSAPRGREYSLLSRFAWGWHQRRGGPSPPRSPRGLDSTPRECCCRSREGPIAARPLSFVEGVGHGPVAPAREDRTSTDHGLPCGARLKATPQVAVSAVERCGYKSRTFRYLRPLRTPVCG